MLKTSGGTYRPSSAHDVYPSHKHVTTRQEKILDETVREEEWSNAKEEEAERTKKSVQTWILTLLPLEICYEPVDPRELF